MRSAISIDPRADFLLCPVLVTLRRTVRPLPIT